MLVAELYQGRTFTFKINFNLVWKSVSCHTKSNHAVLCTNCSTSSSVSFHMEILLAFTLSGSGVCGMAKNVAGGAASSCCPCLLNYIIFPFSFKTCFSVVCRCFPHKFQYYDQMSSSFLLTHFTALIRNVNTSHKRIIRLLCKLLQSDSQTIISCWPWCYKACS